MKKVESQMNLPALEEEVLDYWQKNQIFEKSLDQRKNAERYSFYDGPPFATGTPHYGHIVASIIKDVVPRYWTMKGYYIPRIWGWDCHGLPIENIAEKDLGILHKKDIEKFGIDKFNEFCRSKVLQYTEEWERVINRLGRWADMKNAYKTMDRDFMESVWWVFKQLWEKGLIYEDYRSMHICPRCETTLSQSEVSEGYKDVKDLSLVAEFKSIDDPGLSFLAWTTTPWTLLGNVALAVGPEISYVEIKKKDLNTEDTVRFILAKDRLNEVFEGNEYKIIREMKGKDLVGRRYVPLFDYKNINEAENKENGWQIVPGDFVTTDEGTGIVHIAPAFGEDDLNLGRKLNLPFIQHVGMDGIIKPEYGEFSGLSVKPIDDVQSTDVEVIKYLAAQGTLFDKKQYLHSYPHCWRCDTPLLNYATSSWFVNVTEIKSKALETAREINWSPNHLKNGRFGKWLEGARDWSISRQRFWASVIPIWRCQCGEMKVIGSVSELENLSGQQVQDLHKHIIDKITFGCEKCQGEMKRVPDVLDTWFDSGCMPYAQNHYPFEKEQEFDGSFPAEFIGEGVDQTRAWFYYLHVIANAIFEKNAFKNVIVNGIVLAEDGKKMSKRMHNYPDPSEMFNKYGADVMRYYLLTSPVMAAENLNFKESEMAQLSRGIFRMIWNSYYFFNMYNLIDQWQGDWRQYQLSENILDRWIISELESLNKAIENNMKKYDLVKSSRLFTEFVDNLSNWYIRRSRKRFWKSENDTDKNNAYATLHYVLAKYSLLFAPFCPFISEEIFRNITGEESVHLQDYPTARNEWIDEKSAEEMRRVREIIEVILSLREEKSIKVRQPLTKAQYTGEKISLELENIISEEVNVKEIEQSEKLSYLSNSDSTVSLDTEISNDLKLEGVARDVVREIQVIRKKLKFDISDRIEILYDTKSEMVIDSIDKHTQYISNEVLAAKLELSQLGENAENIKIAGSEVKIILKKVDA